MTLPYFREWVDNWRSSPRVRTMTLEQRGAFHEMLCISWQMGPLPTEPERLAMLIGVDINTFLRAWVSPLTNCWRKTKKGLVNARLERERKWSEERQTSARYSRKFRKQRNSFSTNVERASNERSTIQNQIQIQKKKEEEKNSVPDKPVQPDEIPDGVTWHPERGVEFTEAWKVYLSNFLCSYGESLDVVAPSSAGVRLSIQDFKSALEDLNARLFADTRLRPGPKSKPGKWRQFKSLVRNHFVRALNAKRKYATKRSGVGSGASTRDERVLSEAMVGSRPED